MKKLHATQIRLLDILARNIDDPLSIRELQEELGLSSKSLVAHHIEQLEKKGYLKRNPSNPQDYQILSDPEKPIAYLNLYGLAQCGPNGSILDGNPVDRIAISTRLLPFPASQGFLVKARGNSMMPTLHEGDIVVARRTSERHDGQLVVCVNDGQALIKTLRLDSGRLLLQSTNPDFPPFIAADDFRVEGVVEGVFKQSI